jgi:rubrerythrin
MSDIRFIKRLIVEIVAACEKAAAKVNDAEFTGTLDDLIKEAHAIEPFIQERKEKIARKRRNRKGTCRRCGHRWKIRKETLPKACPACKSPYWNRAYKKKKGLSESVGTLSSDMS